MTQQLALDFGPPPAPTLDNFIIGDNGALLACLQGLRTWHGPITAHRFVYVWGAPGVGKTHLLRAFKAAATQAPPSIQTLDDVERLDAAAQQSAFTQWIEAQGDPEHIILAAGRWPPRDLSLREDLRTRIGAALVFEVRAPSDAAKIAALKSASWQRGFILRDAIAQKLLDLLPRDLGSLAAAIAALDRFSLERKRPITLPLLREWLQHEVR